MIGQTVLNYRIEGRLGQGGMGVVYRATDLRLLRTVALKFIPDEISHDPDARERFLREARAASALDHVNVGTIFGVEQAPDGRLFIAMAYYEGETLARLIARGPLGADQATDILRQVAAGLQEAHSRGIIHRDIKPSNIMLTRQGIAKIVDFGLASVSGTARLTVTGAQMGTPHYMSPEQALGQTVDHRSDLWSLGVVLHEMLTGQSPFQATSTPAILYRIVHEDLSVDGLDPVLAGVIARALRKDPAARFQSARQLALALEGIDAPEEPAPNPTATTIITPPAARRSSEARGRAGGSSASPVPRRWLLPAVAAAVVAVTVLVLAATGAVTRLVGTGTEVPAATSTGSLTANDRYLDALTRLDRWDKGRNLADAIDLLKTSVQENPSFALAHARLAEAYRLQAAVTGDRDVLRLARQSAEHAAELKSDLPVVQLGVAEAGTAQLRVTLRGSAFHPRSSGGAGSRDRCRIHVGRSFAAVGCMGQTTRSVPRGRCLVLVVLLLQPLPVAAEPVAVRRTEGAVHGFLVLRTLQGKTLADGDLVQVARGHQVTSRLTFRFRDGSLHDETTVFTQRRHFRLVRTRLIQKGPAFPRPLEMSIDRARGQIVVRYTDDGEQNVDREEMELPADLANGMILTLVKNLRPDAPASTVSMIAATPEPRLVKLKISASGKDRFSTGATARKATHFVIAVDLGGLSGLLAPLLGKQPPDSHVWVLGGEAPAFVRSEQPLYAGGPLWRIELTSPVWPSATHDTR